MKEERELKAYRIDSINNQKPQGLNRKQFLQDMGVLAGAFILIGQKKKSLLSDITEAKILEENIKTNNSKEVKDSIKNIDSDISYIAQKTDDSCAVAVMAMLIADKKNENVKEVYKKILDYYDFIEKSDLVLSSSGLEDYLEKENLDPVTNFRQTPWQLNTMRKHLAQHDSTIVDVTSNYETVIPDKNAPNHWIIIDRIVNMGTLMYSLVRDPFRSEEKFDPMRQLLPFMIPSGNGSIYIPTDNLFPALGSNYIYLKDASDDELFQGYSFR
jgi:hypothetical protein